VNLTDVVTSATAVRALVDIEVWASAATRPAFQVWFDDQDFAAGQQRSFPATWQVPADTAPGTYTVKLAVFSPGWAALYEWEDAAATVSVTAPGPGPTPPPEPSFTSTASVTPLSIAAGGSVNLTDAVTSATAVRALVDIEVWAPGGTSPAFQVSFDDQDFAAGQQRTFPATWQVPVDTAPGTYTVKLAVFSPGWAALHDWDDAAANISVTAPGAEAIANRGFEGGATSWSLNPHASIDTNPANAHAGSNSLKLVATAAWQGTSQIIPVIAGETYALSGWARSTTDGGFITFISRDAGGGELGSHIDLIFPGIGSWTLLSGTYVPPAGTVQVWVGVQSSGIGTFWFDDLSLTHSTPATPKPVHVQGNRLVNAPGQTVTLRGVNRMGTEYACVQGWGMSDGPRDAASIQAMKAWGVNAVRLSINEDCWLAINGVPPAYGGANYQRMIKDYVSVIHLQGLYAILELHWNAPGTALATGQQPMPDADHTPTFWSQVASAFKGNDAVIFDLFNEPWPDEQRDSPAAWTCWRDGGTCPGVPFQAAGMQTLVDAVRATGATNVIALGGVSHSNALSQWLTYAPRDPLNNLAASWHVYNFNACNAIACFESTVAPVAAQVPVIASEIGVNDCGATFLKGLMSWLDAHQMSYLAWTWNLWGPECSSLALISDYAGTPTPYGQIYKAHLGTP
jgi:hypothetical protein